MYRDNASGAIIYTPEDILLFRESPFACWMERLCLEQPDHGIAPDPAPSRTTVARPGQREGHGSRARALGWREFLADLGQVPAAPQPGAGPRDEKDDFAQEAAVAIARSASDAQRRTATLRAMREGVESIAHGQIAIGPLSCRPDLLVRTAGASDLGDHLYLPCAVRRDGAPGEPFQLSCAADLLHSLQGALPAQVLVLGAPGDLTAIRTADHLEVYRAVKKRFMAAQLGFRREAMPDPVASSHFGRWSTYAAELLRSRASSTDQRRAPGSAVVPLPGSARAALEASRCEVAG